MATHDEINALGLTHADLAKVYDTRRAEYFRWAEALDDMSWIDAAIQAEVRETPPLLFSDFSTCAILYLLGYGKHRDRILAEVVAIRLEGR